MESDLIQKAEAVLADIQAWLDNDECDCPGEGHICGRIGVQRRANTLRAAVAEHKKDVPKTAVEIEKIILTVYNESFHQAFPDSPGTFSKALASRLADLGVAPPLDIDAIADEIGEWYQRTYEQDPDMFADCLDGLPGGVRAILGKHIEDARLAPPQIGREAPHE